jgi:outer membrane protein assembly factor BamB
MVGFRIVVLTSLAFIPVLASAQPMSSPGTAMSVQTLAAPRDWTTWGYDQERTGWNRGETVLTKQNVSRLKLLWNTQLSTIPRDVVLSTLTAPLVVENVQTAQGTMNLVVLLGADDTAFAVNADTGKVVWQKTFPNAIAQVHPTNWECSNTANATPVIDKQRALVFLITSDGKLRGLTLADGAERMTATDMVVPFARDWSLNLIDNVVYTTNGRGCGQFPGQLPSPTPAQGGGAASAEGGGAPRPIGPIIWGNISAMDVSDLAHPRVTHFYTSGARPAGPWGRGGVAKGPGGTVITQTADGPFDPGTGVWGETVLKLAPQATRVVDSFTPGNWKFLNAHDLDFGSGSPEVFTFQNRTLVATAGKEGAVYLLDANNLGGGPPDHATPVFKSPQLGNDAALGTEPGQGMWSGITSYETADGRRFLYVPIWGPPSKNAPAFKYNNGPIPNGSIMAFQVTADGGKISLDPQWTSPNLTVPDAPVVANDVVYAIQTGEQTLQRPLLLPGQARPVIDIGSPEMSKFRSTPVSNLTLYAFDAQTGKTLWSSDKIITNWVHFSEPVVALGKVFVVTHDAHVFAFGLK